MTYSLSKIKSSKLMDYTLYVPGQIFSIYGMPFVIWMLSSVYTMCEIDFKGIDIHDLEAKDRLMFDTYFVAVFYFIHAFAVHALCRLLSSIFKRERPSDPLETEEDLKFERSLTLRNENTSKYGCPCEDVAHASLFGYFLMIYFPTAYKNLGALFGSNQFILALVFCKCYYHLNYVGDTLVALPLGIFVVIVFMKIGIKSAM